MPRRHRAIVLAGSVVLAAAPGPANAQAVRARGLDAETGAPLAGALVSVLSAEGAALREAIATPAGRVVVGTGGAGAFRLRVRRIGYQPWMSPPVAVAARDTADVTFHVAARRITLPPVRVTAAPSRCRRSDDDRAAAAALYDQIRIALDAAELTRADTLVRTRITTYEQTLDRGGRVLDARSRELGAGGARPFFPASLDSLSRLGWVVHEPDGSTRFFAPSAEVLLAPRFGEEHCFGLVRGTGPRAGLVGLSFEPVPSRRVPEIAGALWADSATLELRELEYRYVRAPLPIEVRDIGGRLELEKLPSGGWIERRWSIRMPRLRAVERFVVLEGYLESGARAHVVEGGPLRAPAPALRFGPEGAIAGVVHDSLSGAPMSGASVLLRALGRRATTDAAGRFTLDRLPPGRHDIEVTHPSLDSLGFAALLAETAVAGGATALVELATPSFATLSDGRCDAPSSIILGRVRDAASRASVAGATVTVEWATRMHLSGSSVALDTDGTTTTTGPDGRFFLCVRAQAGMSAFATLGRAGSERVVLPESARRVVGVELVLMPNYRVPKLIR